jgi:hypothetical protein
VHEGDGGDGEFRGRRYVGFTRTPPRPAASPCSARRGGKRPTCGHDVQYHPSPESLRPGLRSADSTQSMSDTVTDADRTLSWGLLVGTGTFTSLHFLARGRAASGADVLTTSVRRVDQRRVTDGQGRQAACHSLERRRVLQSRRRDRHGGEHTRGRPVSPGERRSHRQQRADAASPGRTAHRGYEGRCAAGPRKQRAAGPVSAHKGRATPEITRFKGLGEMMPPVATCSRCPPVRGRSLPSWRCWWKVSRARVTPPTRWAGMRRLGAPVRFGLLPIGRLHPKPLGPPVGGCLMHMWSTMSSGR